MDYLKAFQKIMEEQNMIALATSVDNVPNVRIVNFCYDSNRKGVLYFTTFKGNPKEKEFARNTSVSFTTVPSSGSEHVRVSKANVQRSDTTVYDLKDVFKTKVPDYEEVLEMAGDQLVVYEIHFQDASVTLDIDQSGSVTL